MKFPVDKNSAHTTVSVIIALSVLALTLWAVILYSQRPYAGASWSFTTGKVLQVDIGGPSEGILMLGDQIVSIDGQSVWDARGYAGRRAGEILHLVVLRDAQTRELVIPLIAPDLLILLDRLTPLWIGLAFWIMGSLILVFDRSKARWVMFRYGQIACAVLACGAISSFGPLWTSRLFGFLLWWAGPVAVHVHITIFQAPSPRFLPRLQRALYAFTVVFSITGTIGRIWEIGNIPRLIQMWEYIWLGLNFALVLTVTVFASRRGGKQRGPRSRLNILTVLTALGILPLLVLSLLPEVLFKHSLLPYEVSFLFFALLPAGYTIIIFQERLSKFAIHIDRSISLALASLTIAALYLLIYYGFMKIYSTNDSAFVLTGLVITLLLIALRPSFRRWAGTFGNVVFFGEEYDFQAAIQEIEKSLFAAETGPQSVGENLCKSLQRIMRVDYAGLLLLSGDVVVYTRDGGPAMTSHCDGTTHGGASALDALRQASLTSELRETMLDAIAFCDAFRERLEHLVKDSEILLPIQGSKGRMAVLFLGSRKGFGGYSNADMDILESIASQARTALENAYLLGEAQELTLQTAQLNRQVMQAREDERKRVARDLHDQVIQSLVGLNFQMAELRDRWPAQEAAEIARLQEEVRDLSHDLRAICSDLRPPALDMVGLIPTIESRITDLRRQVLFRISFHPEGDEAQDIPDDVAVCVYRIFQEAVVNVVKHSQASHLDVILAVKKDQVCLTVRDDGRGFTVPEQIGAWVDEYHFGLVGLKEMVQAVNGDLAIQSSPGNGCQVQATIPLNGEKSNGGEGNN